MDKNKFSYFYKLRTRYSEVDLQGIVFNAHFLTYFDTALKSPILCRPILLYCWGSSVN